MPFKSPAQRRFMFARHPKIAQRWAEEEKMNYPSPEKKAAFQYSRPKKKRTVSAASYDEPTTGNQYRQGVRDAEKINRNIKKRRRKQRYTVPKDQGTFV